MERDGGTAGVLAAQAHRPCPLPRGPWIMVQEWRRLLVAHWRVDAGALVRRLPAGVALDRFQDEAWLAVTPFVATVRPRALPAIPYVSTFAELNVRTYVVRDGRPGVYFFSLDATSVLAVLGARVAYALPYFPARATADATDGEVRYRLQGWRTLWHRVGFAASSRPVSPAERARPGTLEHWLVERYRLYTTDRRGRVWHADIHHRPWPLQRAAGTIVAKEVAAAAGVDLPEAAPLLHYADELDVLVWPPRPGS